MTNVPELDPFNDAAWQPWQQLWRPAPGVTYLNHGAFGIPPEPVRQARAAWQERLDRNPMQFFVREVEAAWEDARDTLAEFVGARGDDLVFVDNATAGMNVVADSFPLKAGDEVLLTDHEYGAVKLIWERRCAEVGAALKYVTLPLPFRTANETVDAIVDAFTDRTRMLIVSHITSPTAVTLPVAAITAAAKARDIAVCIDGPHAVLQLPLNLTELGADYYVASCHKWLSGPFGSGFLHVHPRRQNSIRGPRSFGTVLPRLPQQWWEEFIWLGTRDAAAYLAVPTAIGLARQIGEDNFRRRTHAVARYARQQLQNLTQLEPIVPDDPAWYGCMAHVPLPPGEPWLLARALWDEDRIEIPIVHFGDRRYIRVSCPLYVGREQVDFLTNALRGKLERGL